jgi:hypothetical protein
VKCHIRLIQCHLRIFHLDHTLLPFALVLTMKMSYYYFLCPEHARTREIRQCRLIGSWNKSYGNYIREKQKRDRTIASQFSEDTTSNIDTSTDNDTP